MAGCGAGCAAIKGEARVGVERPAARTAPFRESAVICAVIVAASRGLAWPTNVAACFGLDCGRDGVRVPVVCRGVDCRAADGALLGVVSGVAATHSLWPLDGGGRTTLGVHAARGGALATCWRPHGGGDSVPSARGVAGDQAPRTAIGGGGVLAPRFNLCWTLGPTRGGGPQTCTGVDVPDIATRGALDERALSFDDAAAVRAGVVPRARGGDGACGPLAPSEVQRLKGIIGTPGEAVPLLMPT